MSTIIKMNGPRGPGAGTQPLTFNYEDVADQARAYFQTTKTKADELLQQARHEASALREQAKRAGLADAAREAETRLDDRISQELSTLLPALSQAVAGLEAARQEWLGQWQNQTIRLATLIAEKIVRRELLQRPEITSNWIREALDLASSDATVRLCMHPQDCEKLKNQSESILAEIERIATVKLVADPHVSPGGCIVRSEFGEIDQTVEAQLARIEEELTV